MGFDLSSLMMKRPIVKLVAAPDTKPSCVWTLDQPHLGPCRRAYFCIISWKHHEPNGCWNPFFAGVVINLSPQFSLFLFFFLFHKKGKDKVFCKNILGIAEFCILKNPLKFSLNCSVHFVNHFLFYFIKHTWSLNSVLTLHSICF